MIEKVWAAVGPYAVTAPGTATGRLTLASTFGLRVKMRVQLSGSPELGLEVKRVTKTWVELGPIGSRIGERTDLTAYGIGSTVYAPEQPRNFNIPLQEIDRQVYEEEPVVAIRTILVDPWGDKFTVENPLPVQLSDGSINIETLNANLSVFLTHLDNYPVAGDEHDSVRIGDGVEQLAVNPDGSINVNISSVAPGNLKTVSVFNEVSSVASALNQLIATYTVPVSKTGRLQRVETTGTNIADYTVRINAVTQARKRSMHGDGLNTTFEFSSSEGGVYLATGDVVTVYGEHNRPMLGDFSARIQVLEVG